MKSFLPRLTMVIATALWVLSFTLMVSATMQNGHTLLAQWALLTGLWGCVTTIAGLLCWDRYRVEDVATIAARTAIDHKGLRSAD